MFFKGEFYQQAEQLDRELNALWDKYPSLMPYGIRLKRGVDNLMFTGSIFLELKRAIDGAVISMGGFTDAVSTGWQKIG